MGEQGIAPGIDTGRKSPEENLLVVSGEIRMHPMRPGVGIARGYGSRNARFERKDVGRHHPAPGTACAADSLWIDLRPGQQVIHRPYDIPCHEIENMRTGYERLGADDLVGIAGSFGYRGVVFDLPLPLTNGIDDQRHKSFSRLSNGPALDLVRRFTGRGVADDVENRRMGAGVLRG